MRNADQEARQALIAEIERAFDGVARGNGITLHQARVRDDSISTGAGEKEEAEARKLDTDTRWQDVPDSWMAELGDDLIFISDPEGFRYYVPAFMIWTLRNYGDVGYQAEDQVAWVLGQEPTGRDAQDRCGLLSPVQKKAIAHFLQMYVGFADEFDAPVAQRALDEYWNQFL